MAPAPTAPDGIASGRGAALAFYVALVVLLAFALFVRITGLPMIEMGGDAVKAWFNAKQLTYHLTDRFWEWDHHSVRFAIIVPTWIIQKVFGTRPLVYYVFPLSMALLQVALLWAIGRRIARPGAAFVAILATLLFPQMERVGAQILGEVPSGAYALLGGYFLLCHRDATDRRRPLFAAALSVALFLAYLTKITNVLFVPGFALGMWLLTRRWRDVLGFLALLFAFFCVETALYRALTKFKLGQLSIITSSHLADRRLKPTELRDFFTHVLDATTWWQVALVAFAIASVIAFAGWRRFGRDVAVFAILAGSFLLLQNFAVKSIHPLVPVQRFLERYMLPALPLMMLVIGWVLSLLAERAFARLKLPRWVRPAIAVAVMLGLGVKHHRDEYPGAAKHPFKLLKDYEKQSNRAFAKGTPVVALKLPKDTDFFLKVLWSGYTGATPAADMPRQRKARYRGKPATFVLHPSFDKDYEGQKDQAIFESWFGREIVETSHSWAPGGDMGGQFSMKMAKLKDPR